MPILKTFKTSQSPSDAAKELKTSASRLHYHVSKLAATGLLVAKGKRSKSTLYETVAKTFYVPEQYLPELTSRMPEMLEAMLDSVKQGLVKRFEGKLKAAQETHSKDRKHFFTIDEIDAFRCKQAYPELLRFDKLYLTPEQYRHLTATVVNALNEFRKQSKETAAHTQACSLNFICFQEVTGPA